MPTPSTPLARVGHAMAILLMAAGCAPATPAPGSTQVSRVDRMTLVYVPAGQFLMGSGDPEADAEPDERPQHTVFLDAFWLDRTEVTNEMYLRCIEAGACTPPVRATRYGDERYASHPIIGVTWGQAQDYCRWAGRRLPTEAEWEKAARGTDGRRFPWGNDEPTATRANFDQTYAGTSEVGRFPDGASPYGVLDMAGNVWEWVADGYDAAYYQSSPKRNPPGAESANQRVLRGGAWNAEASAIRVANRFWAFPGRNDTDGFRCARDG